MIEDAVKKLEEAIRRLESQDVAKRAELLGALDALKGELARVTESESEKARSVAGFAEVAAHEATRGEKPSGLLKHALEGLAMSAKGFEVSHPRLVEAVDRLATMLARIGI